MAVPAAGAAAGLTVIYHETRAVIDLPTSATVAALKDAVRRSPELAGVVHGKAIRLIAMGRILSDDAAPLAAYRLAPGAVVHMVLTDAAPPAAAGAAVPRSAAATTAAIAAATGPRGHLGSVAMAPSAPPATAPADDERAGTPRAPLPAAGGEHAPGVVALPDGTLLRPPGSLRGFERLALLGLGADEISMMRGLYMREVEAAFPPAVLPPAPGEPEALRMLRAEDAWMATQHPLTSEFAVNLRPLVLAHQRARGGGGFPPWLQQRRAAGAGAGGVGDDDEDMDDDDGRRGGVGSSEQGTLGSLVAGAALGMLLGLASLCWLCSSASTRRFKQGIVLGIMISATLNLVTARMGATGSGGSAAGNGAGGSGRGPIPYNGGGSGGSGGGAYIPGGPSGGGGGDPSSLVPFGPGSYLRGGGGGER